MMYAENPLRDLHDAMAHAQYVGFKDERDYLLFVLRWG